MSNNRIPFFSLQLDFALSILPIALFHLIIPPVSYFRIGNSEFENLAPIAQEVLRMLYSHIPTEWFNLKFLKSLMFDEGKHSKIITHQWITSLFVHADYGHLLANLSQTIIAGYKVHCNVGSNFVPLIYFLGGIGAHAPVSIVPLPLPVTDISEPESFMQRFIRENTPLSDIEKNLRTLLPRMPTQSCGSSGAVCALVGSNFVSHFVNIFEIALVFNSPYLQSGIINAFSQVRSSYSSTLFAPEAYVYYCICNSRIITACIVYDFYTR
jgi:membrane associated rhomboid family serine protease